MSATCKTPTTIYRLRISPLYREDDDIRHLRALLKALLRRHHLRALSIEIEREADAEHASAGNKPVPPGLSPLQAFQHALWGWHDQRRRDDPKHRNQQTHDSSQDDAAAITREFLQQAATTAKDKAMATKNAVFPSRYLKAADLDEPVVLTVSEALLEELRHQGRVEKKVVLHFQRTTKVFPLNKVNWDSMEKVTGKSDSDDWAGCKIELYPTQTEMRGETVDCIRIRKPGEGQAESSTPEPPPEISDSIPF
jgi:hypothetical protein